MRIFVTKRIGSFDCSRVSTFYSNIIVMSHKSLSYVVKADPLFGPRRRLDATRRKRHCNDEAMWAISVNTKLDAAREMLEF